MLSKYSPHQQEESNHGSKEVTITDELQELRENIEKLKNQTSPSAARVSKPGGCPFSSYIVNEPLHAHYKTAKIANNDGSNNREEHLTRFENLAMLHCYRDQIKCGVFLTTLVDSAQRWFVKLKPVVLVILEIFSPHSYIISVAAKDTKRLLSTCLK